MSELFFPSYPEDTNQPVHGGDVQAVCERFGFAVADCLDLSTGMNPDGFPVPPVPDQYYRQLPLASDTDLIAVAKRFYRCKHLVAAAGSQRLIEILPTLRPSCRVAVPDFGYQEHRYHWQKNHHSVSLYNAFQPEQLEEKIMEGEVDVLVVINPCNPTAAVIGIETLLRWRQFLAQRGGWLIIDEAFVDMYPHNSFSAYSHLPAVVVLRSLGKFFGLAGLRIGFALAEEKFLRCLSLALGPWSVAGPSQYIAEQALADTQWQYLNRQRVKKNSRRMLMLLQDKLGDCSISIESAMLFIRVVMTRELAEKIASGLAERGIVVRLWVLSESDDATAILRFGLISEDDHRAYERLRVALNTVEVM